MPTYTYRCRKCEHVFEEFHPMTDEKPRKCPKCRARAARVPGGGGGLLFKGTGFYITDYRSKSYQDKAKKEGAPGGSGSGSAGSGGGAGSGGSGKGPGAAGSGGGAPGGAGSGGSGKSGSKGQGGSSSKSGGE